MQGVGRNLKDDGKKKGELKVHMLTLLYKKRWSIETVFKKLKQNFQLHFFWSDTENGIKSQYYAINYSFFHPLP